MSYTCNTSANTLATLARKPTRHNTSTCREKDRKRAQVTPHSASLTHSLTHPSPPSELTSNSTSERASDTRHGNHATSQPARAPNSHTRTKRERKKERELPPSIATLTSPGELTSHSYLHERAREPVTPHGRQPARQPARAPNRQRERERESSHTPPHTHTMSVRW